MYSLILVVIVAFLISIILVIYFAFFRNSFSYYSRWAKKWEYKSILKRFKIGDNNSGCGIPFFGSRDILWVDDSESHTLIIGSTGSGKTRRVINPLVNILASGGESMILTDPKAELYESVSGYLKELGYNVILLNFRNPQFGNTWNPLTVPYSLYLSGNVDKSIELLEDLAINIFYDDFYGLKFNNNAHILKGAADYFCGLAILLFEDGTKEEINLSSISYMSNIGNEHYENSKYLAEYFKLKGKKHPAYMYLSNMLDNNSNIVDDVIAVFNQKIRVFSSRKSLSEMLSYSDFSISDICNSKTAVFIMIHDEKTTYHALSSIFTKQCYEVFADVAQNNNGSIPIRTNFILDEFGNMPAIRDFTNMITASRSRKIRFYLSIQSLSQLDMVYKYEPADIIKGNCSNIVYLLSNEMKALESISKLCGDKIKKDKNGTVSGTIPLISISDLQRMKLGDAIIIKQRMFPIKTKLRDQSEYDFRKLIFDGYRERKESEVKFFNMISYINKDNTISNLSINNNLYKVVTNKTSSQKI